MIRVSQQIPTRAGECWSCTGGVAWFRRTWAAPPRKAHRELELYPETGPSTLAASHPGMPPPSWEVRSTPKRQRPCLALSRCWEVFIELNIVLGSPICVHIGCWKIVCILYPLPPSFLVPNQPCAPTILISIMLEHKVQWIQK